MEGAPVPRDNTKGSRGNKGKADVQNERTVSMCNHSKLRVVEAKGKKHNWHRVPWFHGGVGAQEGVLSQLSLSHSLLEESLGGSH